MPRPHRARNRFPAARGLPKTVQGASPPPPTTPTGDPHASRMSACLHGLWFDNFVRSSLRCERRGLLVILPEEAVRVSTTQALPLKRRTLESLEYLSENGVLFPLHNIPKSPKCAFSKGGPELDIKGASICCRERGYVRMLVQ
jgi:hypothetical protein